MADPWRLPLRLATDVAARAALLVRRGLLAAADAVVPPQLALFEQAIGIARTELLHAVARLGIADRLADGPRTTLELATAASVDEATLRRVLRALATSGVFRLRRDGRFENSRLSAGLRSSVAGSMHPLVEYLGSAANVASWAAVDVAIASGRSAFRAVHGMSVWEWLAVHPEEERSFAAAMVRVTELQVPFVAWGYPFRPTERICDVGGGHGALLAGILRRHPRATGVLLDAPQVVARARSLLEAHGVADRVQCVAGDLRESVPAGCDSYLLKDVLHDWDDGTAIRILEACRRSAPRGARILVIEMLVDRGGSPSAALVDLQMLVATEQGRQRAAAEHEALMRRAGIEPRRTTRLAGLLSVVEGVAR